jgi:hypothetical protein
MNWVKKYVVAMSGDIWTYVGLGIAYLLWMAQQKL